MKVIRVAKRSGSCTCRFGLLNSDLNFLSPICARCAQMICQRQQVWLSLPTWNLKLLYTVPLGRIRSSKLGSDWVMNNSFLGVIPVLLNTTQGSGPLVLIQKKCPGSFSTLCFESCILKSRINTEALPIASLSVFTFRSWSYLATFT